MKDLKEIHVKPNESFDMDLATTQKKTRRIKLCGLLASLKRGRALHLVILRRRRTYKYKITRICIDNV